VINQLLIEKMEPAADPATTKETVIYIKNENIGVLIGKGGATI
jgi:predicted RNA-binding protein YlqC (UPF0109 family)